MIYITGDLHGSFDNRLDFLYTLKAEDVLIVLGDFGFSWSPSEEKIWNDRKFPFTTVSIFGNHENFTRIEENYENTKIFGAKAHKFNNNTFYVKNGEMLDIEGKKFFCFGGALSIDKHWRTPYLSWWPQEQPTLNDLQHALDTLEKYNWTFDYLLTHTAETELVQTVLGSKDTIKDSTEDMIQEIKYQIEAHGGSYKRHFFGHLHSVWEDPRFCCLYDQIYGVDKKELKFSTFGG